MSAPAVDDRLAEILLAFVDAEEQGKPLDRENFLAAHPEFAEELGEFFASRATFERFAKPLRQVRSGLAGMMSPQSLLDLGQLGDFKLVREVGRGGMGIVYEAHQESLNRRVALKMLPFVAALDPRQLQRFKNEAQAAALLHHSNIVPVHAIGCDRGVHFYAMQFIEGQSLANVIEELRVQQRSRQQTVPPTAPVGALSTAWAERRRDFVRRVAELGRDCADALEHAHLMGVVHRDIKPANVLLDAFGQPWLTDFGLAQLQNSVSLTTSGELVGTLRYMSPEQASGRRGVVDHRTDIYSLGATLYELLTRMPLFDGRDRQVLLHKILDDLPRLPRQIDPEIPLELETILLKTLAKAPSERYATARELGDDFRRFLSDQPILARRPSLMDRAAKWSRRHRPIVVSATAVLLLAICGSFVSTLLIAAAHRETSVALVRERERSQEAENQRAIAEANFRQARRAVDFLAEVSEEELVERTSVNDIRRKLLAGALDYYQEFIDRHENDPRTRAELIETRQRVADILEGLTAEYEFYQSMPRTMLLMERAVVDDLKLDEDQQVKIDLLGDTWREQRDEVFRSFRYLPPETRRQRFKELAAENRQARAAVLTPEQVLRLEQIALQVRGVWALSDSETADALQLTREQRLTVRQLQDQWRFSPWRPNESSSRHHLGKGHHDRNRTSPPSKSPDANSAIASSTSNAPASNSTTPPDPRTLLSPEQQELWDSMIGKPFAGKVNFSPWAILGTRSK